MGASAFHVCYGIRLEVDADDSTTVDALERRQHALQIAAKQHRLQSWWGTTADKSKYFLFVGHLVGHFGWEGESVGQLSDTEAAGVVAETRQRLVAAGIEGQPKWHFQFEPDR